jgi:Asp-tRNA(Asn)/Glu-tRNA(Gln) amidotransferase A subunit family amidase
MSSHGPVKNVWKSGLRHRLTKTDPEKSHHVPVNASTPPQTDVDLDSDWYVAGGSSGGSAVAVASGTCFGLVKWK